MTDLRSLEQIVHDVAIRHLSEVEVIPRLRIRKSSPQCAVRGKMLVEECYWSLELRLPEGFPSELPKVYVARDLAGKVEHVAGDGHLCVLQEEGAAGDYRRPEDLIGEILQRARRTLEGLAHHPPAESVLNELEAYCGAASTATPVYSYFAPGSEVLSLRAGWADGKCVSLSKNDTELDNFLGVPAKRFTQRRALYVPLKDSASEALKLPLPFAESAEVARRFIVDHCADSRGFNQAQKKSFALVILGFPRKGRRVLVAVDFANRSNTPNDVAILPVQRSDRAALGPRGGASAALDTKTVTVVGCGAVGGYIAHQLAKAGVGRLVLVDHDLMSRENLFRHVLGTESLGSPKASGLAKALRQAAPFCDAQEHVAKGEILLERNPHVIGGADLVVLATGNPAVDLRLSDALRCGSNPSLVAAWVEPLGLGGHVFAAGPGTACLRCLFEESDRGLINRSSFAAHHQDYAVADAGCGGAHTPFSNSDAVRTADLAVQSITDLLKNPCRSPLLRSWKGDPTAFFDAGYSTSPRFDSQQLSLNPAPMERCVVCGSSSQ
jgi:molybdopterin/thiamine biosynthesis adenylyltransferase